VGSRRDLISMLDADADLADLLDESERDRARSEALTRVRRLSPGEWDAGNAVEPGMHHRGFLIIDGLLSREVDVLGRRCVELLAAGDVLRPWRGDPDGSHVHAEVGWLVLEPTQLAVLDHGLVSRMGSLAATRCGALCARHSARAFTGRRPGDLPPSAR
jgi:CRP/FNR family transcriptional regulator, cyclic AMP receptor protein